METKICFVCKEDKPLDDYYKHKEMGDGRLGKCKECCKKQAKARHYDKLKDPEWAESERKRALDKYYRLYQDLHPREKLAPYGERFPEKIRAHILSQRVEHPKGTHRHHWSYREQDARDVINIIPETHYAIHRYTVYDQERMMYRTIEGVLLDTREAHEAYINEIVKEG